MKAIKHPLISLIRDSNDLNLNFMQIPGNSFNSPADLQNRLMKSKVRLKGILKGILEQSTPENVPMPMITFLVSLAKKGQYMPDGFLIPFEMERLRLNELGVVL
jgi:hypothetical protein